MKLIKQCENKQNKVVFKQLKNGQYYTAWIRKKSAYHKKTIVLETTASYREALREYNQFASFM